MLKIFVDGSCKGNGSKSSLGGFGIVIINEDDKIIHQYQSFKEPTTNNEMELSAILYALEYIQNNNLTFPLPIIYSDSAYCVNIINDWMYSWERNGWVRPKNQEIKNLKIIQSIYNLRHLAQVEKVKGHSGVKWNEYVDKLAKGEIKI